MQIYLRFRFDGTFVQYIVMHIFIFCTILRLDIYLTIRTYENGRKQYSNSTVDKAIKVARILVINCWFEMYRIINVIWLMALNATYNTISVLRSRSVLLVEETGENQRPAASHWQTWSHKGVSSTPRLSGIPKFSWWQLQSNIYMGSWVMYYFCLLSHTIKWKTK
jgi:hypothetical protein